jgi:hypothetical protein
MTGITNPPSLKPLSSPISTYIGYIHSSVTYYYSKSTYTLQSNQYTSDFLLITYLFSNTILLANTNLVVNIKLTNPSNVNYL